MKIVCSSKEKKIILDAFVGQCPELTCPHAKEIAEAKNYKCITGRSPREICESCRRAHIEKIAWEIED